MPELITLPQKTIIVDFLHNHPERAALEDKINNLERSEAARVITNIDTGCGRIAYGNKTPFWERNERIEKTARRVVNRIKGVCGACGGSITTGAPLCHC